MRINSFKIKDFRSIESAEVPLSDLTCLVGANNEGKSNILRAAIAATSQMLGSEVPVGPRRRRQPSFVEFIPRRDLPRHKPSPSPSVEIRLELTEAECDAFQRELGHVTNNELRFLINLQKGGPAGVRVLKQRSGGVLTEKSEEIADFVRQRMRLEYIPAVRTAEQVVDVVQRLVADQLTVLRRNDDYRAALEKLTQLEQPILTSIQNDLAESLGSFLPELRSIELVRTTPGLGPVGSLIDVLLDDGVATDISTKGDGVQSLAAIALARRAALRADDADHHLVLAIEEPETHLHPAAIRRLRSVLREISSEQQVILTTHSPLLIDTEDPSTNIVVENQSARPASSVVEIRECLGVAVADNLTSARLVVLVEGPADVDALGALLAAHSERLALLLESGELLLDSLDGASKLSARASAMRATACSVFAAVDADAEGHSAVEAATATGRISPSDYMLVGRSGMAESELEDLLLLKAYRQRVEYEIDMSLNSALSNGRGPKWSAKLKSMLKKHGRLASDREVARVKRIVADSVVALGLDALNSDGRETIRILSSRLEQRFD